MMRILKQAEITRTKLGDSGQTFLVKYKDKKFILRRCNNKKEADFYIQIYKKLNKYKFLPKIIERSKENILFEFIEGRNCRKSEGKKIIYQVGKICACINKIRFRKFDINKKAYYNLKTLLDKNVINKEKFEKIKGLYNKLKRKIKPKAAIDSNDVYPENFRLRRGKVYFIDIEAIKPRLKGQGIAKAFIRWFKTSKQKEEFKRGYNSVSSIKFLTEDYLRFCYLNFLLQTIGIKLRKGREFNKEDLKRINLLLKDKLK